MAKQDDDQKVLLSFLKLMRRRKQAETTRVRENIGFLDSDIAQVPLRLTQLLLPRAG